MNTFVIRCFRWFHAHEFELVFFVLAAAVVVDVQAFGQFVKSCCNSRVCTLLCKARLFYKFVNCLTRLTCMNDKTMEQTRKRIIHKELKWQRRLPKKGKKENCWSAPPLSLSLLFFACHLHCIFHLVDGDDLAGLDARAWCDINGHIKMHFFPLSLSLSFSLFTSSAL